MSRLRILTTVLLSSALVVAFAANADAASGCRSYTYTYKQFRLRVGSIKTRKSTCKTARSVIQKFDAKVHQRHHAVGSKISIGLWKCDVFRSYNPTHTNGLCIRSSGARVTWVETWLNPPSTSHSSGPRSGLSQIASGWAAGDYALAVTSGTVNHPTTIELRVSATPSQTGSIDWNMVCDEQGGGVGEKSGEVQGSLPTTLTLPLPAPSTSCIVSAVVQLDQSGDVTISIFG